MVVPNARGIVLICFLLLLLLGSPAQGATFSTEVRVFAVGAERNQTLELSRGQFFCDEGERFSWFGGGVTLRITPFLLDTEAVQAELEVLTLGYQRFTRLLHKRLKLGEKLTLEEIPAKLGDFYRVELILELAEESLPSLYPLQDTTIWGMDESVHFKVHFVRGSLGDYNWNAVVSFVEAMNRLGKEDLNLYYSDKADLYLCPQRIPEGMWQSPSGFGVRPADNELFILYNKDRRVVGPRPINVLAFYKLWGYAPDFVVYGAAGYHANPHFEAKVLMERGELYPLDRLLKPIHTWGEEVNKGLYEWGSFIRFLIDRYGLTRFRTFYERSWDLNLEAAFAEVYDTELHQLQREWRLFLKEYKPTVSDLGIYAERGFFINNYEQVLPYWEFLYSLDRDHYDISYKLATCHYSLGNYAEALKVYRNLKKLRSSWPQSGFLVGNCLLQLGDLRSAADEYRLALARDSTYAPAHKKLGEIALFEDDLSTACKHLRLTIGYTQETEFLSDAYLFWADCMERSGGNLNPDSLRQLGLIFAKNKIKINPDLALSYICLAEAFIISDSSHLVIPLLDKAWELETKPYYLARILIDYGKTYDLLGQREIAKECYRAAKKLPCGFLNRMTAQRYLGRAFKLSG